MPQKTRLYTIYDKVAEEHGPLFEAVNDAIAHRSYSDLISKLPANIMSDYELHYHGEVLRDTKSLLLLPDLDLRIKKIEEEMPNEKA